MTTLALSRLHWTCVFAWSALSLVGCTQVTEDGPGSDPVELGLTVRVGIGGPTLVEGAEVCGPDATNCVTTDADGKATLALPADERITWTVTKKGFGSYLVGDVTDATFPSNTSIIVATDGWLSGELAKLQSPYPFTETGGIVVWTDPPIGGATFDLVGVEGKPYYGTEGGGAGPDLDATTSFGNGGFVEVGPGEVQVKIGGTAEGCVVGWGWPGDGSNTIRMPVVEGFTTYASVTCD